VIKKIAAFFVGILFLVSLWLFLLALSINHTILSDNYIKDTAIGLDLYDKFSDLVYGGLESTNPDLANDKKLEKSIEEGLPPEKIQFHFENIVNQIFDDGTDVVVEDLSDLNRALIDSVNRNEGVNISHEEQLFPSEVNYSKIISGNNSYLNKSMVGSYYVWIFFVLVIVLLFALFFISSSKGGKRLLWLGWFLLFGVLGALTFCAILYILEPSWIVEKAFSSTSLQPFFISYIDEIFEKVLTDIRKNYIYMSVILSLLTLSAFFASIYFEKDPEKCEGSKWWNYLN